MSTYLIAFSFNLCKKYFLEAQTTVNDGLMVVGDNVQDDLLQTTVKDGLVAEQNRRRNRCAPLCPPQRRNRTQRGDATR